MGNFKVGDVCVVVSAVYDQSTVGLECTITSVLMRVKCSDGKEYLGHFVNIRNGKCGVVFCPHELRLKRPPSRDEFTAGSWELCPWSPYRVGETS